MSPTTATAAERVQAGAEWLDEHFPGWDQRIDTENMAVFSPVTCPAGQAVATSPGYEPARSEFGPQPPYMVAHDLMRSEGAYPPDLGFVTGSLADYRDLDQAWKDLVAQRRTA